MKFLIECTTEKQDVLIASFTNFAYSKLGITDSPLTIFKSATGTTSFGSYQPSNGIVVVAVEGRHTSDVLRTLAHELVHHKQITEGQEMSLEEMEYEANAVAGMLMRDFNKLHPEMFDLNAHDMVPPPADAINDSLGAASPDTTRPTGPINMAEDHELVLWGLPKGKTDRLHEVVLSTQCKTSADVEKIKARATQDGWHGFRISHLDLSKKPDFLGAIKEEMGVGGGNIAGIGIGPSGEPGVNPKKRKTPVIASMVRRKTFSGLKEELMYSFKSHIEESMKNPVFRGLHRGHGIYHHGKYGYGDETRTPDNSIHSIRQYKQHLDDHMAKEQEARPAHEKHWDTVSHKDRQNWRKMTQHVDASASELAYAHHQAMKREEAST